jgi:hypothetical protein
MGGSGENKLDFVLRLAAANTMFANDPYQRVEQLRAQPIA